VTRVEPPAERYQLSRVPLGARLRIEHLDGVPWHDAPAPPRWHRHWPQSRSRQAERCACGAIRFREPPVVFTPVQPGAVIGEAMAAWKNAWVEQALDHWLPEGRAARRVRGLFRLGRPGWSR
jgi:hypothetical protein